MTALFAEIEEAQLYLAALTVKKVMVESQENTVEIPGTAVFMKLATSAEKYGLSVKQQEIRPFRAAVATDSYGNVKSDFSVTGKFSPVYETLEDEDEPALIGYHEHTKQYNINGINMDYGPLSVTEIRQLEAARHPDLLSYVIVTRPVLLFTKSSQKL